jgi:hypothetical protein
MKGPLVAVEFGVEGDGDEEGEEGEILSWRGAPRPAPPLSVAGAT